MALRPLYAIMLFLLGPVAAPGLADRPGLLSAATAQESARLWVNTRSGV